MCDTVERYLHRHVDAEMVEAGWMLAAEIIHP